MKEQIIRSVRFDTFNGELTPRFGPLGNSSFMKELESEIAKEASRELNKETNAGNIDPKDTLTPFVEIKERIYNREFPSLRDMNLEGWTLESFATIYDDNRLQMQVAIFSRDINLS